MVVLSVAILTKPGKVLVARQFLPITKSRIENLLAAFPKLLGSGVGAESHTFIETDAVRYVYQPLDQLYVLLITNKQSNIIEDLDTLRLFAKIIPDYCAANNEDAVMKNVFSLVFAFDEVVSLGVKENVTLANIKTNLLMDSHEEKLQKIIMESKMTEAREEARRKAEAIEKQKLEIRARMQSEGKILGFGNNSFGGIGSDSYQPGSFGGNTSSGGGGGGYQSPANNGGSGSGAAAAAAAAPKVEAKKPAGKGMSLGGKAKKPDDFVSKLQKEEDTGRIGVAVPARVVAAQAAAQEKEAAKARDDKAKKRLNVLVEEKLQVIMDKDGGLKKLEVQGGIKIVVQDPDEARVRVRTTGAPKNSQIKCKLHPHLDGKTWEAAGILANKDAAKGYPVGTDSAAVVCKWRVLSSDDQDVPIAVNLWDNTEKGRSVVSVDFKAGGESVAAGRPEPFTLSDVHIVVPCRSKQPPEVVSKDGHVAFDNKEKVLMWSLDEVGPNHASGALEFSVPEMDGDSFFPLNVMFNSTQTYSGIQVIGVEHAETGKPIDFNTTCSLTVDKFVIEKAD